MSQQELLARVVSVLDAVGVPYMISGSFSLVIDDPIDPLRFARRQPADVMGMRLWFSAPEDTIVQKLKWSELSGGSEKQFTDALRVYELQRPRLDIPYIDEWVARLGLATAWQRLQNEAQPLS